MVVTDKPPKGTHFDSATPEGACTVGRYGVVSCAVGDLPSGGSASVTVVFALGPSVVDGTVLRDKVFAFSHEGDLSDADNLVVEKTMVPLATEDGVDTYVPASGGTVSTGSTTTPGNPTSTTATIPETPEGVPAGIDERDAAFASDGCGYRTNCFGQVIDIDVPFFFTQSDPMVFTFNFDASVSRRDQAGQGDDGARRRPAAPLHRAGRDARAVLRVERRRARRRRSPDHRPHRDQRQLARPLIPRLCAWPSEAQTQALACVVRERPAISAGRERPRASSNRLSSLPFGCSRRLDDAAPRPESRIIAVSTG